VAAEPKLVRLVQLDPATIDALAAGDLALANRTSPIVLTPYFVSPECLGTWQRRSRQLVRDPLAAGWITRAIHDERGQLPVGRAGFHGPPDERGMVEFGYAVDPRCRRQGYARASLLRLLEQAVAAPEVTVVRATISPVNEASRNLVLQYGFVEVGEQWDDEDGIETIFELPLSPPGAALARL
jgi:ribosomal-protein-alanine N-acetyltransferase